MTPKPVVPADTDYQQHFGVDAAIPTEPVELDDNTSNPLPENDDADYDPGINRNTKAELRRLQRIMMSVAEYDEQGSARASAARAWRELEVLRLAKAGKPVLLTLSGKADVKSRPSSAPITPDFGSKAA